MGRVAKFISRSVSQSAIDGAVITTVAATESSSRVKIRGKHTPCLFLSHSHRNSGCVSVCARFSVCSSSFLSKAARTQHTHTHTQTPRALYRPCLSVRRVSNYSQTHTHAAITPHAISFMITRLRLVCRSPQRLLSGCSEGIAGVALGIAPAPGRPPGYIDGDPHKQHQSTNHDGCPEPRSSPQSPDVSRSKRTGRLPHRAIPVEAYARLAAHARARARHGPSCCHERPLRHRRRRSPTRASPRCSCA